MTGLLKTGVPREFEGLQFTFSSLEQYSGFQVTRSPGTGLIWTACSLLIIGLGLVYYLPLRQAWALVEPGGIGKSRVLLRFSGKSGLLDSKEIDRLSVLIARKYPAVGKGDEL